MNRHENPRESMQWVPVNLRHYKYEEWPQSPLHFQRDSLLDQIYKVDKKIQPKKRKYAEVNYAKAYEFRWSDTPGQQRWDMCEFGSATGSFDAERFEADINQWLAKTRHQDAITTRLFIINIVADDDLFDLSMTRPAFEAIEKDFDLHPATPNLLNNVQEFENLDFTFSNQSDQAPSKKGIVWLVNAFESIISGEGWKLSLKYDTECQRTDAILFTNDDEEVRNCIINPAIDDLLTLHRSWKQFRVLPQALLQQSVREWLKRVCKTRKGILDIEEDLGASRFWLGKIPENWPHNVDIKKQTLRLHDELTFLSYVKTGLQKSKRLQQTLTEMESWISKSEKDPLASKGDQYSTWTESLIKQLEIKARETDERAHIQADLLFSIVSQQDNHENISLAQSAWVFTFITALFLPCTVVASIFSMGMFNWQPDAEVDSENSYISNKFWIYWTVSLPLTILVMGGWYWWCSKGMKLWGQSSREAHKDVDLKWLQDKSRFVRFCWPAAKPNRTAELTRNIDHGYSAEL